MGNRFEEPRLPFDKEGQSFDEPLARPLPGAPSQTVVQLPKHPLWDKWATRPEPTQARALLGNDDVGVTFQFNPMSVQWDYQENIVSRDTLGGRVVQLLSLRINGMSVQGVAGSRKELQRLVKEFKAIMGYHVHKQEPVFFKVPSRNWNFRVYLTSTPQIGWDVTSTSYPFQMELMVEDDIEGIKTRELTSQTLTKLATGVGFDPTVHGGNAQKVYNIVKAVTANGPFPYGTPDDASNTNQDGTSIPPEDCTGANCTIAAYVTALAKYLGVSNPTSEVIGVLVGWAALEGGSIHNSATYNPLNTTYDGGLKIGNTGTQGNIAVYRSFSDGVKAAGETLKLKGHGYEKIIDAMAKGDAAGLIDAIHLSDWCGPSCYDNGKALSGNYSSYAKEVLP